jgi:hypothetical protein
MRRYRISMGFSAAAVCVFAPSLGEAGELAAGMTFQAARLNLPSTRRAARCLLGRCIGARETNHTAKPRVGAARTHLVWTRAVCTLTKGPGDGTANPCKFTCPDPPPLLRVGCSSGRWYFSPG